MFNFLTTQGILATRGGHAAAQRARRWGVVAALATSLLMSIWLSAGPVPTAHAFHEIQYCNTWLAPWGQPGDSCAANWGGGLYAAGVRSYTHSGCVSVLNSGGGLAASWKCTSGPNDLTYYLFGNDGVYRRGIVRNNAGGSNHVYGWYQAYGAH